MQRARSACEVTDTPSEALRIRLSAARHSAAAGAVNQPVAGAVNQPVAASNCCALPSPPHSTIAKLVLFVTQYWRAHAPQSWPSRSRGLVSVVTHPSCNVGHPRRPHALHSLGTTSCHCKESYVSNAAKASRAETPIHSCAAAALGAAGATVSLSAAELSAGAALSVAVAAASSPPAAAPSVTACVVPPAGGASSPQKAGSKGGTCTTGAALVPRFCRDAAFVLHFCQDAELVLLFCRVAALVRLFVSAQEATSEHSARRRRIGRAGRASSR